jgi:hypothetical protein
VAEVQAAEVPVADQEVEVPTAEMALAAGQTVAMPVGVQVTEVQAEVQAVVRVVETPVEVTLVVEDRAEDSMTVSVVVATPPEALVQVRVEAVPGYRVGCFLPA